MSEGIKGFFNKQGLGPDLGDISAWAQRRGLRCKRERDGQGFAIDGALDGRAWRLEWGPSQRPYIEGQELRLRMDLPLPTDLLMMLLTRPLMESLEKQAFDEFTQGNQTQLGSGTPEETRWLVLFPKISFAAWPVLRGKYGGASNVPEEGTAWLDGPLARELEQAAAGLLREWPPWLLMTSKGRMVMRLQSAAVDETGIASALGLFETACTEAIRIGAARGAAPR